MAENATVLRPLSEVTRNNVVNDILDSLIKTPNQSTSFRASETKRIARRRRVSLMQVAGVRAALTSGVYGKVPTLVRNRKKAAAAN